MEPCPGPGETEVFNCGQLTSDKNYVLCSDLYSSGTCITIDQAASAAVLDCRGHSITGSGVSDTYGIELLAGTTGVTVKNCILSRWWVGILLQAGANSNTLQGNTASSNHDGIWLMGNSYNSFQGNNACGNSAQSIYCDLAQTDNGGNRCSPTGANSQCHSSITCGRC
jgi:parallel beta-helix repeat protein